MPQIMKDKFIADVEKIIKDYQGIDNNKQIAQRIWFYLQAYRFKEG